MPRIRGTLRRSIPAGVIAPAVTTAVILWVEASSGDTSEGAIPSTAGRPAGVTLCPDGSPRYARSAATALGHLVGGT